MKFDDPMHLFLKKNLSIKEETNTVWEETRTNYTFGFRG